MRSVRTAVAIVVAGALAAPAVAVFPLAVSTSRFLDIAGFSGRWFASAAEPFWLKSIELSIVLGIGAATAACVIAVPAAYAAATGGSARTTKCLDGLAVATLVMPVIALAVGYFRMFGESDARVLFLADTTLCFAMPYLSLRMASARLSDAQLQAAELLGATRLGAMFAIWIPNLWRPLALGWVLAFLTSWDETVLSVFVAAPGTTTLARAIWETMQRERDLTAAAINALSAPLLSTLLVVLLGVPSSRGSAR